MAYMEWDSSLETGIPTIDQQHKRLVALVNELHDAMKSGKGRTIVGDTLKSLAGYTDYHFNTEERAFDSYGYPDAQAHKAQHSQLIRKVGELMIEYAKGEMTITMDTLQFLTDWVKTHIRQQDKAYVPFLAGKDL